ncbi:hypothetical protein AVEN_229513-1 [Araneus ventricosus]|uniref:Uncharacterized protein n=1 Tax=Araneus ventricosus TaxID=182803 RepID=A0A4Y2EJC3_ARAVE|nr:hypothetical protein AVEN_229513-1 [Araneus ventricosus]
MFLSGVFRDLGLVGGGGGWRTNQEPGSRRGGEAKVNFWSQSGVTSKEQLITCSIRRSGSIDILIGADAADKLMPDVYQLLPSGFAANEK